MGAESKRTKVALPRDDRNAASFGGDHGGTTGPISDDNSVRGTVAEGGPDMRIAYDPTRSSMIVGQPRANIVSIFTGHIFADGFE